MSHSIEASTLRILKASGETVGTGFLVSPKLAVTCAHVIDLAELGVDGRVVIQFTGQKYRTNAVIHDNYFSPEKDIALLQVNDTRELAPGPSFS